jgi:hypothetical protein
MAIAAFCDIVPPELLMPKPSHRDKLLQEGLKVVLAQGYYGASVREVVSAVKDGAKVTSIICIDWPSFRPVFPRGRAS